MLVYDTPRHDSSKTSLGDAAHLSQQPPAPLAHGKQSIRHDATHFQPTCVEQTPCLSLCRLVYRTTAMVAATPLPRGLYSSGVLLMLYNRG
jgi:hypothetical protein